jgi:hypothetical protein
MKENEMCGHEPHIGKMINAYRPLLQKPGLKSLMEETTLKI